MKTWSNEKRKLGKGNADDNTQVEIRKVLERFQEGYIKRDVNLVDSFVKELFCESEDILIVGTADSEWFVGVSEVKKLFEGDWKYWGDLRINIEDSIISSHNDVAWVTTEGTVSKNLDKENMYNHFIENIKEDFEESLSPEYKVIGALKSLTQCLNEAALGEKRVNPVRISYVLIKVNGKWKFHSIHFSNATILAPDVRIIGDKRIG